MDRVKVDGRANAAAERLLARVPQRMRFEGLVLSRGGGAFPLFAFLLVWRLGHRFASREYEEWLKETKWASLRIFYGNDNDNDNDNNDNNDNDNNISTICQACLFWQGLF